MHLGEQGYLDHTARIMQVLLRDPLLVRFTCTTKQCCCLKPPLIHVQAATDFKEGLKHIPELRVIGEPDMCNVAFTGATPGMNIYAINDLVSDKGWHLNALQRPAAVHMCFTAQHVDVGDRLIQVPAPGSDLLWFCIVHA